MIELLVVISIMMMLTFMVVPAANNTFRNFKLESTYQQIVGQLNFARQTALTQGRAVEVRFYYLPDTNDNPTASPTVYRGMQCFIEGDLLATSTSAPVTAITKPYYFSSPIVLLNDSSYSTVLNLTISTPTTTLSGYKLNYRYVSFRFKANGQSDLTDTTNCLTLAFQHDGNASGSIPSNFRTVEVNSHNGIVRSFQP
jgi:uncharacterized protein (TIGR02596 family)